jgi:hypothetical protein
MNTGFESLRISSAETFTGLTGKQRRSRKRKLKQKIGLARGKALRKTINSVKEAVAEKQRLLNDLTREGPHEAPDKRAF